MTFTFIEKLRSCWDRYDKAILRISIVLMAITALVWMGSLGLEKWVLHAFFLVVAETRFQRIIYYPIRHTKNMVSTSIDRKLLIEGMTSQCLNLLIRHRP